MSLLEFRAMQTDILPKNIAFELIKEQDRIKYDLPFEILINKKVFFFDEYFTILDFIYSVLCWQKKDIVCDMTYNSYDTDENPLISFIYDGGDFFISSPWQLFECEMRFTKEQILDAIDELKKNIMFSAQIL